MGSTLRASVHVAALTSVLVAAACGGNLAAVGPIETAASTASASADPSAAPTTTPTSQPTAARSGPDFDQLPVPANDPVALSQQLVMVEQAVRDPKLAGPQLDWMGHLQQLGYSRLADYPDWREAVLAALPAEVRPAVTGSLEAGRQLRMMTGPIPKSLPEWKIVEPRPVEELLGYYREAEATYGVPWYYLASIHLVETRMGRIRGLSSAGAQGPMQFIPSTWALYGRGDVNSDRDSILAAARYLRAAGAPGDMARAVYAYNHDSRYVRAVAAYAEVMHADPAAYRGYHGWQVYYSTADGPVFLPVGWIKT